MVQSLTMKDCFITVNVLGSADGMTFNEIEMNNLDILARIFVPVFIFSDYIGIRTIQVLLRGGTI